MKSLRCLAEIKIIIIMRKRKINSEDVILKKERKK